jgi:golgi phosphoprotein 3
VASKTLRLHHELLLLALHDQKGTLAFGRMVEYGIGGAIFTELLLAERLRLVERGGWRRGQLVEVADAAPTGDPAMDAALTRLAPKRRASPASTVTRIGGIRGLRNLVAADLAQRGVLQESKQQVLALFQRRVYPTLDPQPERALVARIRQTLEGTADPDARTAALVGLAEATDSLSAIYSWRERRKLRRRIKAVREADVGSKAARDAIQAVTAAMAAGVVAAAAAG